MAEYKNGVNAFGNMSVSKEDRSAEVETGRAVFVDEDKYANDPDYKLKVDKCLAEGFHRVGESGGGSSDFSTAEVTIVNNTSSSLDTAYMPHATAADAEQGSPDISVPEFFGGLPVGTSSYNAILYKGSCYLDYASYQGLTASITGSASKIFEGAIVITGDCTITLYIQ